MKTGLSDFATIIIIFLYIQTIYSVDVITTIAGSSKLSYGISGDRGEATSSQLYFPYSIALDFSGNLYIADSENNRIRVVTKSTGIISTVVGSGSKGREFGSFAGDGGDATSSSLAMPTDVSVDTSGIIIYYITIYIYCIMKLLVFYFTYR